ncbi:MAG TPA: sulfotransferase, partial [Dongiaceae bacterium]|nr:sulfotransferase [Dongiaceae bacterium]
MPEQQTNPAPLQAAHELHRRGRLPEAEAAYRAILRGDPANAEALHLLGLVALQSGRPGEAVDLIRQALSHRTKAAFSYNLGHACIALRDFPAAEAAFRQTLALSPRHAEALFHLGNLLRARDDRSGAVDHYRQAVTVKPEFVEALINLGVLLAELGDREEAITHLERAHELRPEDADILVNLGATCAQISFTRATEAFRRALALQPGHLRALVNLGHILASHKYAAEAAGCFEAALAREPRNTQLRLALARTLAEQERADEAQACYEQVIADNPSKIDAHLGLARLHRHGGRFDDSAASYANALQIDPRCVSALVGIVLHHKADLPAEQATRIETLAASADLPMQDRRHLHFALAQAKEAARDYDRAFHHMAEANRLRLLEFEESSGPYDPDAEARWVAGIMQAFDAAHFQRTAGFGINSELPVYIVGMPRSGTTLCEQILASHSQVFGAGELPDIYQLVEELTRGGSSYAGQLTEAATRAMAERELARLLARGPAARRVTDKHPFNFCHLGLIATLFPQVRIVHCRRDPMDTCLSCFSQDLSQLAIWSGDLTTLGHAYRMYERLMAHWRAVLPARLLEVDYEQVVEDFEGQARRLIAFCGLEWEEACLTFHRTDRL